MTIRLFIMAFFAGSDVENALTSSIKLENLVRIRFAIQFEVSSGGCSGDEGTKMAFSASIAFDKRLFEVGDVKTGEATSRTVNWE